MHKIYKHIQHFKGRRFLFGALFFSLFGAAGWGPTAPRPALGAGLEGRVGTDEGVIVAMGNSLTEGMGVAEASTYPARLERKLRADGYPFRVINAGVSGETSNGTRARLNWVMSLAPDIVILETGANDGLRGLRNDRLAANLEAILSQLRQRRVVVVLAAMRMLPNLGEAYTREFEQVYRDAASSHDVIFIPFFLEGVATRRALTLPDGLHPNADGYAVITDNVYPYVIQAIERLQARQ